jgi:protein TonB
VIATFGLKHLVASQSKRILFALLASVSLHLVLTIPLFHSGSTSVNRQKVNLSVVSKRQAQVSLSAQETFPSDLAGTVEKGSYKKKIFERRVAAKRRDIRIAKRQGQRDFLPTMTTNAQAPDISVNISYTQADVGYSQDLGVPSGGGNATQGSASELQGSPEGQDDLRTSRSSYAMLVRRMLEDTQSYPLDAMEQEIEGNAKVVIEVGKDGNVVSVRLSRSSGHRELDKAILSAARSLRRLPEPPGGAIVIAVPIAFKLEEERF